MAMKLAKRLRKKQRGIDKWKFCPYCSIELDFDNSSKDHLIPRSRGGKFLDYNKIVCCKKCNFSKSCLMPLEFIFGCKLKTYYDKEKLINVRIISPFQLTK